MKCAICHTDIKGRYLIDAWGQLICAEHKAEFCSSCGRFIASTDLHLADGRCLCPHCRPSVVSLPQHVEWVEKRVRTILSSRGITDIPAGIPIKIVTPNEMARLNGSRQLNLFQPGLTQTTKLMGLFMSSCKHTIYIFDYLPKIQFAGVLAHEMLHAWQNEKGISLLPAYTEGFCNVGSYVVYEAINTDLARFLIKRLKEDPSPVYGEGFRKVVAVYQQKMNLRTTMEVLKH